MIVFASHVLDIVWGGRYSVIEPGSVTVAYLAPCNDCIDDLLILMKVW